MLSMHTFCQCIAPPLCWRNGKNLTRKDMMKIGFKAETLHESKLKHNARKVEAKLQKMYHHLPYGSRLWKQPDMGASMMHY